MIESQALVVVMANGFIAALDQLLQSGGPEVFLGTLAMVLFGLLGLAAALRADLAPPAEPLTKGPAVVVKCPGSAPVLAEFAPARLAEVKGGAFRLTRRPDARRRDKPRAIASQVYRPSYVLPARVVPAVPAARPPASRGLALFVERRSGSRRVRGGAS